MKLEIGSDHAFEIRRESIPSECRESFTVLFLSDLHLNKHGRNNSMRISETIGALNPTIILFGGDYADSSRGLNHLNDLLRSISGRKNVFAIAGNHDYRLGIDRIKKVMQENNVAWIEEMSHKLKIGDTTVGIDGNRWSSEGKNADVSILVLHKPRHADGFKNSYDLALAGHLHGGQIVLWRSGFRLFPGRLFYRWNILKEKFDNCLYLISKGLGDTLPIRYNCRRDMVFVEVIGNKQTQKT